MYTHDSDIHTVGCLVRVSLPVLVRFASGARDVRERFATLLTSCMPQRHLVFGRNLGGRILTDRVRVCVLVLQEC